MKLIDIPLFFGAWKNGAVLFFYHSFAYPNIYGDRASKNRYIIFIWYCCSEHSTRSVCCLQYSFYSTRTYFFFFCDKFLHCIFIDTILWPNSISRYMYLFFILSKENCFCFNYFMRFYMRTYTEQICKCLLKNIAIKIKFARL